MLLVYLVMIYASWLFLEMDHSLKDRLHSMLSKITYHVRRRILIGDLICRGHALQDQVKQAYYYQFSSDLPKGGEYKNFSSNWLSIAQSMKETGAYDEENIKLFEDILDKDIQSEKKLRDFYIGQIMQMLLVGAMMAAVLLFTLFTFGENLEMKYFYAQIFFQAVGLFLFTYLIRKKREKLFESFFSLTPSIQMMLFFHRSGLSVSGVFELAQIELVHKKHYPEEELEQVKNNFLQSVGHWKEYGTDIHDEMLRIYKRSVSFFDLLVVKLRRSVSGFRILILAIFFLGTYLINMLILLQTFMEKSFYTAVAI